MAADPDQLPAPIPARSYGPVPALIDARGARARRRFIEFFTANIRNPNTRKAYYRAACEVFDWCIRPDSICSISSPYMSLPGLRI
jgi:hypothetical protein